MPDLIGQSIGRYHILEQLGQGGMATVFRAFDTRLECDVAIKFIRREKLTPENAEKALKRFKIEAQKTAQLSHPNIVTITDYGEHDGTPYLVMKYLPGGTLKQKLGKPMHWAEAAKLLAPIARALEHAHQQKVIHRDVKPANILLTDSGQPMLSDFGIAKALDAMDETGTLTGTGVGIGTPEYMAPEQGTGKNVDHRADVYSLGIVYYELVTGRKPYTADTPLAVLIKQASEPLPRPKQFVKDLPDSVEKVIFKALANKPEDRYQSMGEFAAVLEKLAQGGRVVKLSQRSYRRLLAIAGTLLGLAALTFVAFAFWRLGNNQGATAVSGPVTESATSTALNTTATLNPVTGSTSEAQISATPSRTPKPTGTLPPPATDIPAGTVLFEDDFEQGISKWRAGQGWEMRSDDSGNQFFCVRTASSDYSYISAGSPTWKDYVFDVQVMLVKSLAGSANVDVRAMWGASYSDYVYDFSEQRAVLTREIGPPYSQKVLASMSPRLAPGKWQAIRFEANGPHLAVFLDNELVLQGEDDSLDQGAIVLGAGGSGMDVCFDGVRVTALGD